MLTGVLPYATPSPSDLERLIRGDLVTPPRKRNPRIPSPINDIVMKAVAPQVGARYQRASELLKDLLAVRSSATPRSIARQSTPLPQVTPSSPEEVHSIHTRLRARETPKPTFCWHCRKPLHARSARCPFCSEAQ
jgi:hypothetical protein